MACKNIRVPGYHVKGYRVPAKTSGRHKHKGYTVKAHRVKGHTRKVC